MKSLRQLGVLLLLFVVALAPAAACAMPASHSADTSRACCRPAHQTPCGMMQMRPSSKADCCAEPANPATHNVAVTTPVLTQHTAAHLSVRLSTSELASLEAAALASLTGPQFAPPKSPPGNNSILRI